MAPPNPEEEADNHDDNNGHSANPEEEADEAGRETEEDVEAEAEIEAVGEVDKKTTTDTDDKLSTSDEMQKCIDLLEDLLSGITAADPVIAAYRKAEENPDIPINFIEQGNRIIENVLLQRHREAIVGSLVMGRKENWKESYLNDMRDTLRNAREGIDTIKDPEVLVRYDFNQSEALLLHMEALEAANSGNPFLMLNYLKLIIDREVKVRDGIIWTLLRSLCVEVEKECAAYPTKLGPNIMELLEPENDIVEVLRALLLGRQWADMKGPVLVITPFHSNTRLFGARLLSDLIVAMAAADSHKQKLQKHVSVFNFKRVSSVQMDPTAHFLNKQRQNIVVIIMQLLEQHSGHFEHAALWGILKCCKIACANEAVCQEFILAGLLVVIESAKKAYMALDELDGPKYDPVVERRVWKEKKPFIRPPSCMPLQDEEEEQKISARKEKEKVKQKIGPAEREKYVLARQAIHKDDWHPKSSNLLYLFGENEETDWNDFRKVCDRNMMILMFKEVAQVCEKTRSRLKSLIKTEC